MERRVTTQDISWFLDLHRNKQLDLDPSYQRKSVWSIKDRKSFLDTIFRGYPCPAIFLFKSLSKDGKQMYHVVDGKQRLETVIKFVNNEIPIDKDFGDVNINGKKWKDLDASPEYKTIFWNYVFSVEFINIIEGTVINEVFDRLNRNARKLERQEIRHARFDGWFISTIESEAAKDEWVKMGIVTKARARRMKDCQFLSELFMLTMYKSVSGFDQDVIDGIYANYDNPSDLSDFSEDDILEEFEATKTYILKMLNESQDIGKYIKSLSHMYSLWAVVTVNLSSLPEADIMAAKYLVFMNAVNDIANIESVEDLIIDKISKDVYDYHTGSQGAITDNNQRVMRYKALRNALLN